MMEKIMRPSKAMKLKQLKKYMQMTQSRKLLPMKDRKRNTREA